MSGVAKFPKSIAFDNEWIEAVDDAPRPGRPGLILVLGAAASIVAIAGGGWLGQRLAGALASAAPSSWAEAVNQGVFVTCVCLPLWLAAWVGGRAEGRSVWRGCAPAGIGIGLGGLVGVGGFGLAALAANLVGALQAQGHAGIGLGNLAVSLAISALQCGGEEIMFRGWIQPVVSARLGPWIGLVVTSGLFALIHLVGAPRGVLELLNLALGGVLFGLLAFRTGGLWAPFAAHLGWNWTEASLLGLDPNPGVSPLGAVLDFDLVGPNLLGGGTAGMNGSLIATAVLSLLIVALAAVGPSRTRRARRLG